MPDVTHVATLVSHTTDLRERHAAGVASVLPGAAAPRWLAPGTAADIGFAPPCGSAGSRWTHAARQALGAEPIDIVVQPIASRRKRLLVADMDSTIIAEECIDELAAMAGRGEAVSALTRAAVRGEADFETSLRRRVALLAGTSAAVMDALAVRLTPRPGAAALVATMRAHGSITVLASGGFTRFTAAVAASIGFDRHHGNMPEIAGGRLTGGMQAPLLGPAAKAEILRSLLREWRLAPAEALSVGDGANDLPMLAEAGLGVAFHASAAVAAVARARIDHSDLTALLFLQGYEREEIVGEGS